MSPEPQRAGNILLADDDPEFREILADVLSSRGFTVLQACDRRSACDVFRRERPDAVLLDMRFGQDDGVEVLDDLRAIDADAVVVVLTAYVHTESAVRSMRAGAYDYLRKPVDMDELFATLDRAMRLVRLQSEKRVAEAVLGWQRAALEQTQDAIAVIDLERRFRFVNGAWAQLHGRPSQDFDGASVSLCSGETRAFLERALDASEGDGVLGHTGQDGEVVPVHVSASPLHEPSGAPAGIVVVARDISRLRQLEEQLFRAQRIDSLGRLAGGVAHDFNNLLVPILGYTDTFLDELSPDDPRYGEALEIQRAAGQARDLTRQLLAFGRQQVFQLDCVSLNDIVRRIENMLRRTVRADVNLHLDLASTRKIRCDPSQIEQVILNLALNARDAMPDGGRMTIGTRDVSAVHSSPVYVELSVADEGTGMRPEVRARMFDPFFSTKGDGGTGLGLSTVDGIVGQHRGEVSVSTELGVGTAVRVLLPVAEAPAEEVERRPPPSDRDVDGTETVAVVEDERAVRTITRRFLEAHGYEVAFDAASSEECLRLEAGFERRIDLLVTDVVLAQGNGLDLYEELAGRRPGLKALFMSGYGGPVIAGRGLPADAGNFLQKPFSKRAFLEKVREAIET